MQKDNFNRSLDFNTKLKYFIASWALVEIVLADAVNKFINILNVRHIISPGSNFDAAQIIWSDILWINLIKLAIVCLFAFLFSLSYTYLARKVYESDKPVISLINAVLAVFGTLILTMVFAWIISLFQGTNLNIRDSVVYIVNAFKENGFYTTLVLLQFVGAAIASYAGLSFGQHLLKHMDEEDKGRLFGIKWYHYLWLWYGISVYLEALLYLLYMTVHAFSVFFGHFQWLDFLGGTNGNESTNSFQVLGGTLVLYYVIALVILYLIRFQRDILSGAKKVHLIWKILLSLLVAFIIPVLLLLFTAVGSS